ncbi:MAG: DUF1552 domain-containing protein [Planctomycetes bacterium]|nr:DUF1552 domain-containing protein [Planctomycetota bacterium]
MELTRRDVLRGAGALLALPFLEKASFGCAARPPLRMGIFTTTGGTVLESWKPKEAGPLGKLPSILRALEPLKEDILVVSGLSHGGRAEGLNGHEHAGFLHLTGAEEAKKVNGKVSASISVDQAAAQAVGAASYLPSLEMGLSNQETRYSWRAADQPVPFEANPRLVFDRMFRGRKVAVPDWSRRAEAAAAPGAKRDSDDQSVIDLVLDEAARLKKDLGSADKHRLDEYLHSVRTVERRVQLVEDLQRQAALDSEHPGPSAPNLPAKLPDGAMASKMHRATGRDPEIHAEYTRLFADLMVLAFQTDTTRVVTFAVGSDEALFPGVVTVGYERHCHTLEHQGNADRVENADPIAREACRQIHAWYTGLFAETIRKMKAIDEGGSSLLDNSLILYTSYMADGGHGRDDYPVLLAGRAQGTIKPGRHLAFAKLTPMSNLYVEMLDRMGAKVEAFGESRTSKHAAHGGRLPGLA